MREDIIQPTHQERLAYIYIRQSTLVQVYKHGESTQRQYGLQQRAMDLGWEDTQLRVIDEDLGRSGADTLARTGFQQLVADVANGRVGAVFALDASRLSRQSSAWSRLLELCALADVLLVDEQRIYDPKQGDDRLLLGLNGLFSEAQLSSMLLQLHGAAVAKAKRGELTLIAPSGYMWNRALKRLELDPDEQVRMAVELVFERFRVEGSAQAVARYFRRHGLLLPSRQPDGGLGWSAVSAQRIRRLLKNPLYGGAYVYGRRRVRKALVGGEVRARHDKALPMEQWLVLKPEAHPSYLSWEEYMANQEKLRTNQSRRRDGDERGAPREGAALLQGLVLCGVCGKRMRIRYAGVNSAPYYVCDRGLGSTECFRVAAKPIDAAVERLFLEVLQPAELELSLAVAHEVQAQAKEIDRQWQLQLERARYEGRLAERRYRAVDPDNRLVARTLEREWNEKLSEIRRLEQEYEDVRRREGLQLTEQDEQEIRALAHDLPKVWAARTTTMVDRKRLLRMVVDVVTLSPVEVPSTKTRVLLQWETGAVSELYVQRRSRGRPSNQTDEAQTWNH